MTGLPALSLPDAERLTEQTLAVMDAISVLRDPVYYAERERIASDLAGLRHHAGMHSCRVVHHGEQRFCSDARRYSDNLRRTAALYGVTS